MDYHANFATKKYKNFVNKKFKTLQNFKGKSVEPKTTKRSNTKSKFKLVLIFNFFR